MPALLSSLHPTVIVCETSGSKTCLDDLIREAEDTLRQREEEAKVEKLNAEAKKESLRNAIYDAMDRLEDEGTDDAACELERAVDAAQKTGQFAKLRVQARKMLANRQQADMRLDRAEDQILRLTRQLSEVHHLQHAWLHHEEATRTSHIHALGDGEEHHDEPPDLGILDAAARRKREEVLLLQLKGAMDEGERLGVARECLDEGSDIAHRVEKNRKVDDQSARKLRGLLIEKDAGNLADKLQVVRERCETMGDDSCRVIGEIRDRVGRLALREQHQEWLTFEIKLATDRKDALRLKQLSHQAKTLGLTVPPETISLLHTLDDETSSLIAGRSQPSARPKGKDPLARLRQCAERITEDAETAVGDAEYCPERQEFNTAWQAIANAKQAKVPHESIAGLEKRLALLEQKHGPRIQVEEILQKLLHAAEGHGMGPGETVLHDDEKVAELKRALAEAERFNADGHVVDLAFNLLERSLEADSLRRDAEDLLRQALMRPAQSEAGLDLLQDAIEEGKRCGVQTLHAEMELTKMRDIHVHREAAEAELQEASKGLGQQGRARLEVAVKNAKSVGVAANKLQIANARLAELSRHEQRCALACGNIRRALPLLEKEPWRLQQLMEKVKVLQPWTAELEKVAHMAQEKLDKTVAAKGKRRELQRELRTVLQRVKDTRAGEGQRPLTDEMASLSRKLEQATAAGALAANPLLTEAEAVLRDFRREGSQRQVAEHRLRLALNAKDLHEIKFSVEQIRALSQPTSTGAGGSGGGEKSTKDESSGMGVLGALRGGDRVTVEQPPHSARLMEAANSMIRHLSDASTKKEALKLALQTTVKNKGEPIAKGAAGIAAPCGKFPGTPRPPGGIGIGRAASPTINLLMGTSSPSGSKEWVKEVKDVLHEARQCGVAPTLIEHTRLTIREKLRDREAQVRAQKALERSLSKKDVSTQEVQRNLRKVKRLQLEHTA